MFNITILIGLYSYSILLLGLLGFLSKNFILIDTAIFLVILNFIARKNLKFTEFRKKQSLLFYFLFLVIFLLGFINLIGALGPELAFDALWYHLTLPKLYLLKKAFYFIPGGTLYYSTMPQLTEMLYLAALVTDSEILAKLIHFLFGLGICLSIYKIGRQYLTKEYSLLAVIVFYSNLVVAWESITAYIDLARTFFELMAFWGILKWVETKKNKWFVYSGLSIGFALSTKTLSFGTLGVLIIIIFLYFIKFKQPVFKIFINLFAYILLALFVALPWYTHAFINRGNPFYPIFSPDYQDKSNLSSLSPISFITDLWQVFTHAADPISPVYIVFLPLIFLAIKKFNSREKVILYFSLLSLIVWYLIPRTGGGRYLLPFLPILSILVILTLDKFKEQRLLRQPLVVFILFIALITIFFRGAANYKYLNYILGKQTKLEFLKQHLEFNFGNFADIDGYFAKNITDSDKVLLYGFHNLYYINFPFIDGSWVKKGDRFNYIAVKEGELPTPFKSWTLIYTNEISGVKLYNIGGSFWVY